MQRKHKTSSIQRLEGQARHHFNAHKASWTQRLEDQVSHRHNAHKAFRLHLEGHGLRWTSVRKHRVSEVQSSAWVYRVCFRKRIRRRKIPSIYYIETTLGNPKSLFGYRVRYCFPLSLFLESLTLNSHPALLGCSHP